MAPRQVILTLSFAFGFVLGCKQIFGIEEATLICPPEFPDCKLCDEDADCGSSTGCHSWVCRKSQCTPVNRPAGTSCSTGVCSDDVVSECVTCLKDEDCPPGGHCGKERACFRCDDGVQNGYERGIDCGGSCKRCLGDGCMTGDQCSSGLCVDGTCCNAACDGICQYCNNPEGNCSDLPKYAKDYEPVCGFDKVCDGFGSCLLRPGEVCASAVQCASFRCENNRCAKLAGEPCTDPLECLDGACLDGVCAM